MGSIYFRSVKLWLGTTFLVLKPITQANRTKTDHLTLTFKERFVPWGRCANTHYERLRSRSGRKEQWETWAGQGSLPLASHYPPASRPPIPALILFVFLAICSWSPSGVPQNSKVGGPMLKIIIYVFIYGSYLRLGGREDLQVLTSPRQIKAIFF